jgi:hypothetical protein
MAPFIKRPTEIMCLKPRDRRTKLIMTNLDMVRDGNRPRTLIHHGRSEIYTGLEYAMRV